MKQTRNTAVSAAPRRGRADRRKAYVICTILASVFIIAMAVVLMSISDNRVYNDYMNQAQLLYYNKDYDGALSMLRKAAAKEKTDECLLLMAQCYENQGNYTKALEVLRTMDTKKTVVANRIESIESTRKSLSAAEMITIAGKQFRSNTTKLVLDNMGLEDSALEEVLQLYAVDSLSMAGNNLRDISRLSALGGLVTLNLSGNQISDLTPLTALPGLRTLYLDGNPISDFSPLTQITTLTSLSLKNIPITETQLSELSKALPSCAIHSDQAKEEKQDITFGGVTFDSGVTDLDLSDMGIRDISALSNCQYLIRLNLSGNEISDLSPLMNLPYLQWLDISYNAVSDLRPLMGIDTLSFLNAAGNSINTTSALTMMNGLSTLYLDENPIQNFAGLRKVKTLSVLGLSSTGLDDIGLSYLKGLSMLSMLNIEDNPELSGEAVDDLRSYLFTCQIDHSILSYAVDFDGLEVPSDSVMLSLTGRNISDINGIQRLNSLEVVDLSGNLISNLYPLQYADSRFTIISLALRDNQIQDITPISTLTKLETLDLANNDISSLQPLMAMTTLRTLILTGNPLSEEEVALLRNTLLDCDIIF